MAPLLPPPSPQAPLDLGRGHVPLAEGRKFFPSGWFLLCLVWVFRFLFPVEGTRRCRARGQERIWPKPIPPPPFSFHQGITSRQHRLGLSEKVISPPGSCLNPVYFHPSSPCTCSCCFGELAEAHPMENRLSRWERGRLQASPVFSHHTIPIGRCRKRDVNQLCRNPSRCPALLGPSGTHRARRLPHCLPRPEQGDGSPPLHMVTKHLSPSPQTPPSQFGWLLAVLLPQHPHFCS